MKVKVFHALGEGKIEKLDAEINQWLQEQLTTGEEVKHTNLAGTAKGGSAVNVTQPCVVVTVWYDKK